VVWILVGSAVTSLVVVVGIIALFVTVVVPGFEFGGRDQIPSDLPVYPGAKLESALATGFQGCIDVSASWSTPAPEADVIDFYNSQLNTGAWSLTDTNRSRAGFHLSFESRTGAHREGVISVLANAAGATSISLDLVKSTSSRTSVSSCHVVVGDTG
jgi:fermentation-respiration switch protein FrsA (DUF1100 family)